MIELKNVYKEVKNGKNSLQILEDINLTVNEGEFVTIVGASGSGKSTLLNIIGGLDDISQGEYWFDGKKVIKEKDRMMLRRKDVAMIVQNFALISTLSAVDNVNMAKKDERYALELFEKLNIDGLEDKKVKYLSGGEKQRVAIARSLIKHPRLLLADEPTGALDSKTSSQLIDLLSALNKQGLTIILVTHNKEIAQRIGNIYEMIDGKLTKIKDDNAKIVDRN
ncbi:MAG: ABC transporter ATP-binding protein [Erysipelotrichaceae bacterium]|nr:ABC transporter ATP-binding protein [Erysipelotrichaceae bacterium]